MESILKKLEMLRDMISREIEGFPLSTENDAEFFKLKQAYADVNSLIKKLK